MASKVFIWTLVILDVIFFGRDIASGQLWRNPALFYVDGLSGVPVAIVLGLIAWGIGWAWKRRKRGDELQRSR